MFKVNNKNTITTPECRSGVFIVNFEHISHLFLVFLLLTLNMQTLAGLFFLQNIYKMMKNAFYFILKALFVHKMFKFLSRLFGHVGKAA